MGAISLERHIGKENEESNIKINAPATYYTQGRMVTAEDYNVAPLGTNQEIIKVKAINRTASGISRYFDLIDATGKYSNTNLFGNDGVIYKQENETVDNICEECRKEDESVKQNLIMYSYKICNGCNLAKKIFPL